MRKNVENVLDDIRQYSIEMQEILSEGETIPKNFEKRVCSMVQLIRTIEKLVPPILYNEYKDFFTSFSVFCSHCAEEGFLAQNIDILISSFSLLCECLEALIREYTLRKKKCVCCGNEVLYMPIPGYYDEMKQRMGNEKNMQEETINRSEYLCPACGASDRDRLITVFLKKENLQKAPEGFKILQFAPAKPIEKWIRQYCPQVNYDSTDLLMKDVSFTADIQNMYMVPDETYDMVICSHVLEHVKDDRKALSELKRILKKEGQIIFLVPVSLAIDEIDEEWGLSEEENWRRFGQGDHCRRYGKKGLLERLEEQFVVNALGKEYFGTEIFREEGMTDTSTLYVLTKGKQVKFDLEEKIEVPESLLIDGPLVSVLMSCYNHEAFVEEAIESVLRQTYKNIEFLVADDGSTDGSVVQMKKYSKYFAKEFYFKDNLGGRIGYLRSISRGKYIALISSDDVWEPDKLALQVQYMEEHQECEACFTWCMYTDENLNELNDPVFLQKNRDRYEWMRYFWEHGNALCHPSILVRRKEYLKNQSIGSICRQLPDFFLWVDLVQRKEIHVIQRVLVKMRRYQKDTVANVSYASRDNIIINTIEAGINWLWVIRNMEEDFFLKAFSDKLVRKDASGEFEVKCEKYFLMLHSASVVMQNSALCYLAEIYNDVLIKKCMCEKYKYTKKDIQNDIAKKGFGSLFVR